MKPSRPLPKPLRHALRDVPTLVLGGSAEMVRALREHAADTSAFSFDYRDAAFAQCGAWPDFARPFEQVVVRLPKGKDRQALMFAIAAAQLAPDGVAHVVGGKREGIKPARKRVKDHFAAILDVGSGDHVQRITVGSPSTATPTLADFRTTAELEVPGQDPLTLVWYPGVFSHGRLDVGSALFVPHLGADATAGPVLDVGCGAGVLGALLTRAGRDVQMVDVDALALHATQETLETNGLSGEVGPADALTPLGETRLRRDYGLIVSNPPFHQGVAQDLDVARRLILEAPARLRPGGELRLVANAFLPYRDALDAAFGGHEVLAEDGRFRVYRGAARG